MNRKYLILFATLLFPMYICASELASLSISVVSFPDSHPIEGVTVEIEVAEEGRTVSGRTDQKGLARLHGISPGERMLVIHLIGFETLDSMVFLRAGDHQQQYFEMPVAQLGSSEIWFPFQRARINRPLVDGVGTYVFDPQWIVSLP